MYIYCDRKYCGYPLDGVAVDVGHGNGRTSQTDRHKTSHGAAEHRSALP